MDLNTKTIWITGASSGIGEAVAMHYAALGHTIILSARRQTELERVADACQALGGKCYILPLDLANLKHPETSTEVVRKIMEVNFFGQVALSSALVPHFIKAGGGQFAVLSSLTGIFGYGLRSTYAASKHALHGYFESLAIENFKHNIHVTMVCPGRILTNISINAVNGDGTNYGKLDDGQKNGLDAVTCAKKIVRAIDRKKREVLIGKMDLLMVYFKRYVPSLFFKIVVRLDPTK